MKKTSIIFLLTFVFIGIGNLAYSIDLDDIYSKYKKGSLAERLKKEKQIEMEEIGEVANEPNTDNDTMVNKALNVAAAKIAQELAGAKFSAKTDLTESYVESISNNKNTFSSTSSGQNTYKKETNSVNFHSISLVPGSIKRTQKTFSAKFKFILFYNKSLLITKFKPDSFLYAMQDTILNGLETGLGNYKEDFYVMHHSGKYQKRAGYELMITKATGALKGGGRKTNYYVTLEATVRNNNTGYENQSKSFVAYGESRKKAKGLINQVLNPVLNTAFDGSDQGAPLTGNKELDKQNSLFVLQQDGNYDGFHKAAQLAILNLCSQLHNYVK